MVRRGDKKRRQEEETRRGDKKRGQEEETRRGDKKRGQEEFQLRMFAELKRETQWSMVLGAIESSNEEIIKLITAWRDGNEETLEDLVVGQMKNQGEIDFVEKVLWWRNTDMTHSIAQLIMWDNAELKLKKQKGLVAEEWICYRMGRIWDDGWWWVFSSSEYIH